MKKQLLLLFLALLPLFASAWDVKSNGIYYNFLSGNEASVTYRDDNYNSYSGSVNIPSTVTFGNTFSVTSIGRNAFYGCSSLTSITIPKSVTSIGDEAFNGCKDLTAITIPNSVTSIGSAAFFYCSGLTSITVETENANYDSRDNCNAIIETATNTLIAGCMNTVIPNSVTSIAVYAFSGCKGLTSVSIPNSVTSIGPYAFEGCSGLTSMIIPNSVTSIGGAAFYKCI